MSLGGFHRVVPSAVNNDLVLFLIMSSVSKEKEKTEKNIVGMWGWKTREGIKFGHPNSLCGRQE